MLGIPAETKIKIKGLRQVRDPDENWEMVLQ
jgi:hypothetical protein